MRLLIQDVWQWTFVLFVWIKVYERHFRIGMLYAVRHAVYRCNLNFTILYGTFVPQFEFVLWFRALTKPLYHI